MSALCLCVDSATPVPVPPMRTQPRFDSVASTSSSLRVNAWTMDVSPVDYVHVVYLSLWLAHSQSPTCSVACRSAVPCPGSSKGHLAPLPPSDLTGDRGLNHAHHLTAAHGTTGVHPVVLVDQEDTTGSFGTLALSLAALAGAFIVVVVKNIWRRTHRNPSPVTQTLPVRRR